jgi:exosome complex exonuclease RRP6
MNTIDSILLDNHNIDKPDSFIKKLMGSIVNSTRLSNQMPIGSEYDYVETLSTEGKEFKTNINDTKEDILYLLNRINKFVHSSSDTNSGSSGEAISSYENVQALIETLLEGADLRFDEIQGIDRSNIAIKAKGTTGQDSGSFQTQTQPQSHLLPKPQYSFYKNIIINNNKNEPFQPKLKTKPHAKRPLNMQPCYYSDTDSDANANTNTNSSTCMDTNNKTSIIKKKILTPANYFYQHPYQYELDNIKYPEWQLQDCSDLSNASSTSINIITNLTNNIKNHPYEYVDNKESLYSAISEMSLYNELAVDLEHHSIHTYLGMTCLIQISTRDKDYILDVIALKTDPTFATGNGTGTSTTNSSISNISSSPNPNPNPNPNSYALQELNKVFCDPNIVKIFHGCNHDILWLQRDCGIYVVNCFDTYQACIELEYKSQSLSSLLKKYVHYDASKQYQLSDWRIRPLKNELISYARDDTHYLLFIYDCLRREIFNNSNNATIHGRVGLDSYMAVLNRSRDVCLSRYEKPAFDPLGYTHTLLSRRRGTSDLSATQKQYMAALWMWRDIKARDIDESSTYILTNTDITKLTNKCPMNVDDIKKALMGPSKKPLATFLSYNEKDGILFEILEAVHESFGVASSSSSSSSSKVKSKKSLSDEQINTTKNVVTSSTVAAVASSTAVTFHSLFSFRPCVSQVEKEQVSRKTNGIFVDMMHTDLNLSSFSKDSTSASASTINSASKQFESNWSVACSLSEDENEDDNEDKAQMVLDKCASFMQPYMQPQAFMRNQAVKLNEVKKEESIQTSTSTSTIGGKNRTLTAKENADIEALGTIAVELVEDEIMNKKRKIAEMENEVVTTGPEEAEEGSQYVNLKSNKSSKLSMSYKKHKSSGSGIGNGSSNPGYMRPTASHEAKNVVDYNAISMTTLQEVSAAGNNYGAQYGGSWDKAEKEKEKKREQKLAKKALKAGFGNGNVNGSKSEDAKTRATTDKSKGKVKGKGFNPYFAQLTGTEKVPSRDHDRAYTFK